ncbi:MAG: hypothetical protein JO164_09080 [Candidatus Eremiobacteraeota bacterium]|nr:hypothetical protein [Candidatus Eremiobacteraeota bacterium]
MRQIWNGKANLGELEVTGPAGSIEGLTFRLYDPQARRWLIRWANSRDGELGMTPMIGGFADGRGVFYDRETLAGRPVAVRFVFANLTRDAFTFEQAYSPDDGRTWETNWRASFTRSRLDRRN